MNLRNTKVKGLQPHWAVTICFFMLVWVLMEGIFPNEGICAMCGKKVLDTKNYKQTSV